MSDQQTHYAYQGPPPSYAAAVHGTPTVVVTPTGIPPNSTVITVAPNQQQVYVTAIGNCPFCRVGTLSTRPTCLGFLLCILFFPFLFTGLLFLMLFQETYCTNCGAST